MLLEAAPKAKPGLSPTERSELAKLRAEVGKLRAAAVEAPADDDDPLEGNTVDVDLQKARAVYRATVAAFGAESIRAVEMARDIEVLQESKNES